MLMLVELLEDLGLVVQVVQVELLLEHQSAVLVVEEAFYLVLLAVLVLMVLELDLQQLQGQMALLAAAVAVLVAIAVLAIQEQEEMVALDPAVAQVTLGHMLVQLEAQEVQPITL